MKYNKVTEHLTADYGRAAIADGHKSPEHMLSLLNCTGGCPFLAMADGPVGILRALAVRMGPCDHTGPFTLAAARLTKGGPIMQYFWLMGEGISVSDDERANYARDYGKGASGQW